MFRSRVSPWAAQNLVSFARIYRIPNTAQAYDIHPDGKRFIVVAEAENPVAELSPRTNGMWRGRASHSSAGLENAPDLAIIPHSCDIDS